MANYLQVIFFSLIGGLISLIGGVLLLSRQKTARTLARYAAPFAAGALLSATFLEILPEAMEQLAEGVAVRWMLGGFLAFFVLEHFLHWFHHHEAHGNEEESHIAPLIIAGDSIHNFLDGIAIGAAFIISPAAGIITAVAVAAHEIPQEIGDFGLLLKAGYDRKRVVVVNALSALMSTAGAVVTFWLGSKTQLPVGELLAITGGMFLYIAAADLIPMVHKEARGKLAYLPTVLLLTGVIAVAAATAIAHEYLEEESTHSHQPAEPDHHE